MPFDYTGSFSGSFTGELTSTNGVISSSAQVNYTQIRNKPATISAFQKNSIIANNNFRENTYREDSGSFSTRVTAIESFSSSLDATYATDAELSSVSSSLATTIGNVNTTLESSINTINLQDVISNGSYASGSLTIQNHATGPRDGIYLLTDPGLANRTASLSIDNGGTLSIALGGAVRQKIFFGGTEILQNFTASADVKFGGIDNELQQYVLGINPTTGDVTYFTASDVGSDSQTLTFNSVNNNLTISDGNSVDLSSLAGGGGGGGSSIWSTGSDYYYVNADLQVTGSLSATSLTGSIDWDNVTNVPSGLISSSDQVLPITTSSITNFNTEVSRSAAAAGFGAGGDSIPSGTISSSAQVISSLPSGVVSGSSQIDLSQAIGTASFAVTASYAVSASHEIITELSSSHSVQADSASYVDGVTEFDGDRVVSNTNLPSGIYNVNFGTTGSISEFVQAVFFPNSVPSISTTGFTIEEFEASGSSIGSVSATDAEGQSITFRTASSYTDDFFRISTAGAVTLNTKSTSSMNTDNTPGSGSHPFQVEAVDTFGGVGEKTIYIRVNPNTAPKWRQTSVGGNVITNYTQSLNENSVAENNKVRVYFTDAESDTITIETGSVPSEFSLTLASTYVQLNQVTASLDYETTTSYSLVLTASDQHYGSGDDTTSITYLPFLIQVVDNVAPTVANQEMSSINENSSDGTTVGTISATDSESDTITFSNFTLKRAYVNGVGTNVTGSMGGTSLYDPHSNPFQMNSSGVITRKTGVYINADIADRYEYEVSVKDAFNTTLDTGLITIPITDDTANSITDNFNTLHIIESALANTSVKQDGAVPLGLGGSSAYLLSSGVSQRWELTSTDNMIEFNATTGSQVYFQTAQNISGSAYTSGSTIDVAVTASEHAFPTTKQYFDYVVYVEKNSAPDIVFTNTTANLNTNGARSGSLVTTISFNDVDGDSLNHDVFTFTDPSGQLNSIKSGDTYLIQANNTLSGSTTYEITASIEDEHGFRTNTEQHTFTIAQAGIGTLGGDTTSYILETAVSGTALQDQTGEGNGNNSQLSVTYSPQYNSATVQSYTSSNSAIAVDNNGNLSMNVDVSTTTSASGDTITTDITFRDQYDNVGSGSVTVNVFAPDTLWYAYLSEVGVYATSDASALSSYGDANDDGTIDANYPFDNLADAEMGNSVLTSTALSGISSDKSFLVASGSTFEASNASQLLSDINHNTGSNNNTGLLIVFPSASDFGILPNTMGNALGGSTAGEYVLYGDRVGTGINDGVQSSLVRYFDFNDSNTYPNSSATRFGVIFTYGDASTDVEYFLMSSSGSAPTSTQ